MHDWRGEIRARLARIAHLQIPPAHESDLVDELAQHLDDHYAELRARGRTDTEACAEVMRQLGDESLRDAAESWRRAHPSPAAIPLGVPAGRRGWLEAIQLDLRYGWRSLLRSPVFTIVAVLSLTLGIGANTAIFGLLHAVLVERLAIPRPQELVALHRASGNGVFDRFAYAEFEALRRTPGAPRIEAWYPSSMTIVMRNAREYSGGDFVSGGFFGMLGVTPILGRVLTPDDDRSRSPLDVKSQHLWVRRHDAQPAAVGSTITLNNQRFTVVGVLPRSFRGVMFDRSFTVAVPLSASTLLGVGDLGDPRGPRVNLFARLERGERDASVLAAAFDRCCADGALPGAPRVAKFGSGLKTVMNGRHRLVTVDAGRGIASPKSDLRAEYRRVLIALMAGVAILLLIASANVGNLLLARATTRQRELAVRMSMGATRSRLVQQLLTESAQLALLGAALGFLIARLASAALAHNLPPSAGVLADRIVLQPNPTMLAFTGLTTLFCTLLCGVLPALRATRGDIVTPLKDGARGTRGGRGLATGRSIVVTQVALALVLVCAAALFVATLRKLKEFDGGYRSSRVLLAQIETRGTTYEPRGMEPLYAEIIDRVRRVPGVEVAALSSTLPVFGGRSSSNSIRVPGYEPPPDEDASAWFAGVTPMFFSATGIGIERGRDFDGRDVATGEQVAIVSAAFARRFFAGRDPIGRSIMIAGDSTSLRVVGIARDARFQDLRGQPSEIYYRPLSQLASWPFLDLAARTSGDPLAVATSVRRQIESLAPGIRVERVVSVEAALNDELARERLAAGLATLFGLLALTLAAVGLYGIVAYNVTQRTHEIGVRMALGAHSGDVLWLIVRQALTLTAIGIGIGVPLAIAAARGIGSQLYGIAPTDPRVIAGAATVLVLIGAAASAFPGRRAARIDPVEALRANSE
jgi:predicted permease